MTSAFLLTNSLMALFIIATLLFVLAYRQKIAGWKKIALTKVLLFILLVAISIFHDPVTLFINAFFALLLQHFEYSELKHMTLLFHKNYLDDKILSFETKLFRCNPARDFANKVKNKMLFEYFHISYLSFYFMLSVPSLYYYYTQQYARANVILLGLFSCFSICYCLFIAIPVAGPRYLFGKISNNEENAKIKSLSFRLCHFFLEAGSSKGTAFPSSHTALATVIFLLSLKLSAIFAIIMLPFWLGIVIGVVYTRNHYVVDSLLGLLVGFASYGLTFSLSYL